MQHTVKPTEAGVRISAAARPEQQQALLEEFSKCASGTCSCPSPQYEKVESMTVTANAAGVTVDLTAKPGQALDMAEIERCLDHTAKVIGQ
jgi:aspartate/methionine/tyrosine aminotransferase